MFSKESLILTTPLIFNRLLKSKEEILLLSFQKRVFKSFKMMNKKLKFLKSIGLLHVKMVLLMGDQVLLEVLREVMMVMNIRLKLLENACQFSLQKVDPQENLQVKKNHLKDLDLKSLLNLLLIV